jgi:hypothetical protein
MRTTIIALAGAAAFIAPTAAQAQNPLSSIFQCNNDDNRQRTGAIVGGVLGGVLGNQVAGDDDETLGTILGAAAGAALGSYIGCNLSSTGGDVNQAEAATRLALEQNRSQTWSNARTGASGRIDIVNTFNRDVGGQPAYGNQPGYGYAPLPLNQVRFASGVQQPSNYQLSNDTYRTNNSVNLRAAPNSQARILGQVRANTSFQALARLNNGWLLVGENGTAIGYVSESVVQLEARGYAGGYNQGGYNQTGPLTYDHGYEDGYADGYAVARGQVANRRRDPSRYNQPPVYQPATRELCRTFDQTIQQRGGANRVSERFTACRTAAGDWVVVA